MKQKALYDHINKLSVPSNLYTHQNTCQKFKTTHSYHTETQLFQPLAYSLFQITFYCLVFVSFSGKIPFCFKNSCFHHYLLTYLED